MRPSAKVSWRVGVAGVVVTLVCSAAATTAPADQRPQPNPEELWRAYPLEQKPAKTAPVPAAGAPQRSPAPVADGGPENGPPWGVLAAIAAGILLVGAAVRIRRRPAHTARPAAAGATPLPAPAGQEAGPPGEAQRALPPPVELGPLTLPPAAVPPRTVALVAAANGRPVTPGTSVCQIRWNYRARRFYAEAIDEDGSRRRLARSAVVEWDHPGPPEETTEARGAIRHLAKDLTASGWRPLRARGIDFRERRWYARRFRWPTEAATEPGGTGGNTPDREVAGRSRGAA